jgi:hypothetical protein
MKNMAALVDHVQVNHLCEDAGCCFNEDSFLSGGDACYRAVDYGTCKNLPDWHQKTECGYEGISEQECLNNVQCCYEPSGNPRVPWCFNKFSRTLDGEEGWCEAWTRKEFRYAPRTPCFDVGTKDNFLTKNDMTNINNLVSEEQCHNAKCCFDASLDPDQQEFLDEALGRDTANLYRCFRKKNPNLINGYGIYDYYGDGPPMALEHNEWFSDDDYRPWAWEKNNPHGWDARKLTCDVDEWNDGHGKGKYFKSSCGENLSYYQCVYQKRCCYQPTVLNEPVCYKPEWIYTPAPIPGP